jgi:hypothetical protein
MTTTDEVAERVLPAAFTAQANTCADPQDVLAAVRGRARRQRTARPALMVAAVAGAVAAVVGISATVVNLAGNHTPTDQQIAPASGAAANGAHPGLDQLSGTCLDMAKVKTLWVSDSAPFGGVGTGECSQEADAIQATHPEVAASVNAGNRKVYLAKAPAGIRAGFIALTPTESAAAIKASSQPDTTGGPQYLIVAIPDDNPQDVLVSILTQYQLPAN